MKNLHNTWRGTLTAASALVLLWPAASWAQRGGGHGLGGAPQPGMQNPALSHGPVSFAGAPGTRNPGFFNGSVPFSAATGTQFFPNTQTGRMPGTFGNAGTGFNSFGVGFANLPGGFTGTGNVPLSTGLNGGLLGQNPAFANPSVSGAAFGNNLPTTTGQLGQNPALSTGVLPNAGMIAELNPFAFGYPYGGGIFGATTNTGVSPVALGDNGYPLSMVSAVTPGMPGTPLPTNGPAAIDISVPAGAEVFIQGHKLDQTGATRRFITPSLSKGEVQTYLVRAVWQVKGQDVEASDQVFVMPGNHKSVMFLSGTPVKQTPESKQDGR